MPDRTPLLDPIARAAVLARVRTLTRDDLHALDAATRALAATPDHRRADKGYFFAWWDGPGTREPDETEIQDFFADVLVALATSLTGINVAQYGTRLAREPSGMDKLYRFVVPARRSDALQDSSIGLIEDAVAPWSPRVAVVATWNMACAVALGAHLPEPTRETLETAWRQALGDLPA